MYLDIRSEYQYVEPMLRRQNSCCGLPKIFVEIHLKRLPLQFEGIQMNLIEENIDLLRTDLIFFSSCCYHEGLAEQFPSNWNIPKGGDFIKTWKVKHSEDSGGPWNFQDSHDLPPPLPRFYKQFVLLRRGNSPTWGAASKSCREFQCSRFHIQWYD